MDVPTDRRYLKTHEWHKLEGGLCTIGITQFAADELTDITYVSLPAVGKEVAADAAFGEVESVKATSDLNCGVAGVVAEVNERLNDAPELINQDPFGEGWIIKLKVNNPGALDKLMPADQYAKQVESA